MSNKIAAVKKSKKTTRGIVLDAIRGLENPRGSSFAEIRKYVSSNYEVMDEADPMNLKLYLVKAVDKGDLSILNGKYTIREARSASKEGRHRRCRIFLRSPSKRRSRSGSRRRRSKSKRRIRSGSKRKRRSKSRSRSRSGTKRKGRAKSGRRRRSGSRRKGRSKSRSRSRSGSRRKGRPKSKVRVTKCRGGRRKSPTVDEE